MREAIKSLSQGTLASIRIPLPRPDEQMQICRRLDEIEGESQRLESIYQQKLVALDELKKSLLHRAFSGQL